MEQGQTNSTAMWWIIGIIVVIIIIGGIWWYMAAQNNTSVSTTPPTQTTTLSSEKQITSFTFAAVNPIASGVIDNSNYTVMITVPKGTDVKTLTPTINVSGQATVSPASGSPQDFTNPVIYTVTAEDGSVQNYTVKVTVSSM